MSTNKALSQCYFCPNLCRHTCPVADADQDETSTPQAKMTTMSLLAERKLPWTKENVLAAYKCSHCGQSTETCEMDNPVASVLDQFRAKAFQKGVAPDEVYDYCNKFKKRNNPYGVRLLPLLKKHLPARAFHAAEITYFPGCTEIYQNIDTSKQLLELTEKIGATRMKVFDQPIQCCGYPLLAAGDVASFKDHVEVMVHILNEYPILVSGAPGCVFTMSQLYPAFGFKLKSEVLSLMEYLDSELSKNNFHVRKGVPSRVAYHDPCYQGRYLGIYDEPRRMLELVTGEKPTEFRRHHEQSYCSGGGGLLPVTRPETAKQMTHNRLDEFKETSAQVLVSSCHTCVNRFKKHGERIQVKNIVEFLNQAIAAEDKTPRKDEVD